jgi:hypothetical protein
MSARMGLDPAMSLGRKFANVFMACSVCGNIQVIKSRKGEALSRIVANAAARVFYDPGSRFAWPG